MEAQRGHCKQAAQNSELALPGKSHGNARKKLAICDHLPSHCLLIPAEGLQVPASSHTNFSWKMRYLVFWQIQDSHGLKQLDVGRNELNQRVAYVPLLQVCLLLQRIGELLPWDRSQQSEQLLGRPHILFQKTRAGQQI